MTKKKRRGATPKSKKKQLGKYKSSIEKYCSDQLRQHGIPFDYEEKQFTLLDSFRFERKYFKMRELRGAGVVDVRHIPTDQNPADLFTKVLGRQVFEKHRATVLNTQGAAWSPGTKLGSSCKKSELPYTLEGTDEGTKALDTASGGKV